MLGFLALHRVRHALQTHGWGFCLLFPPPWSFVLLVYPIPRTDSKLRVEMPRAPAPESLVKKT